MLAQTIAACRPANIVGVRRDQQLYEAWAQGDRSSGERLIAEHLSCVTRFFANKCSGSSDLEDLVAATFERCSIGLGKFRGEATFRAYILGIALNVLRDHLRQRYGAPQIETCSLVDLAPSPSVVVAKRAEVRLLLEALRTLPIPLQMVLELHFFEDLSRAEAAAVLDLPAGTVASRLRKAKQELAEKIKALAATPVQATETLTGLDGWVEQLRATMGLT